MKEEIYCIYKSYKGDKKTNFFPDSSDKRNIIMFFIRAKRISDICLKD